MENVSKIEENDENLKTFVILLLIHRKQKTADYASIEPTVSMAAEGRK